jgi:hypothetical protein
MAGSAYIDRDEKRDASGFMTSMMCKASMYKSDDRETLAQNAVSPRSEANKSLAVSDRSFLVIGADWRYDGDIL